MAITDNIAKYWKLDETTGTTVEDATGGTDGTNSGATINQTGKIDKCYDFERSQTDYVDTNYSGDLTAGFTVSGWLKPESILPSSNESHFFGRLSEQGSFDPYFGCGIVSTDTTKFGAKMRGDGGSTFTEVLGTTSYSTGTWYFVVVTYDGTDLKLFVNNVLEDSTAKNHVGNLDGDDFYLGAMNIRGSAGNTYDGFVDEVGVWTRALTDGSPSVGNAATGEVAELYNSGTGITYPFSSSETITKTGNARIDIEDNQETKTGTARIQIDDTETVYDGEARVELTQQVIKTGTSRIELPDNQETKTGNANLILESQENKTGNASIEIPVERVEKTGTGNIEVSGIEQTKTGTARIELTQSETKTGTARIEISDNQIEKTGNASINTSIQIEKTGNANISIPDTYKPVIKSADAKPLNIRADDFYNYQTVKQSDKQGNATIVIP